MAYAFYHRDKELEPEKLLIYLEEEHKIPFFYAEANIVLVKEHRQLVKEDLQFHQNLLALRTDQEGSLLPESPSSLEKLMISPLAWFLYRRKLEPITWSVQELDVATQGTIAHGVFEDIFSPENTDYKLDALSIVIEKRIEEYAPFLKQAHHRLEYEQLKKEITKAAELFRTLLAQCKVTVLKTEEQLCGMFLNMPVSGRTDALLQIAERNLVLDYKKSGKSGRIKRMKSGYDHQLFLYRLMLADADALTAYYAMNDATLIVDQSIQCPDRNGLNIEEIENDCTVNAKSLLEKREGEITKGDIPLNRKGDEKIWEDVGIRASYTLDTSPLVRLYMKEEEAENVEN
jgi:RecB family exonuclease